MDDAPKIVRLTRDPVYGISWWKAPQIQIAVVGIASGVAMFCHGFHIPFPFTQDETITGLSGLGAVGAGVYFICRRIKTGMDPRNPTPPLTK